MKQFLLILTLLLFCHVSSGQRDSSFIASQASKGFGLNDAGVNLSIYPVPVRDNSFTIKSDREITSVRITNIIGQEIFVEKYNAPVITTRIILENTRRGMYLVAITFSDNTRCVRRILVEGPS